MAKLRAPTIAAIALFFLLTFAYAREPKVLPAANDVVRTDLTESDPQAAADIVLPSEKPKAEPEQNQVAAVESVELTKEKIGTESAMPITVVTFHPNSRRPFMPFRRGHRCHGRHRHNFKPREGQRFDDGPREVFLGKDMILSGSGGKYPGYQPLSRDGSHPVPLSWIKFNHGGQRWSFSKDNSMAERKFDRPHHHHHHHHQDDESEEKDHHDHDHDHDHHDGGIMKTIRKFLKHF